MMTEEQQKLVAFLEEKIVSLRFAVKQNAFEKIRPELKHELECAEIALAALSQPASPALKLPDERVDSGVNGRLYHNEGWNACLAEVKRLNAPHTAPIEPICSTGGAEWTGNSLANDALIMLDRIDTSDSDDDYRIEEVKRIVRLLAAAPEGK